MTDRRRRIEALSESVAAWAEGREDVRAVAVIGSFARSARPADDYSDLDLLLVVGDADALLDDDRWFEGFGEPLLSFVERNRASGTRERRVLFRDGVDVDFTIVDSERISELATAARPERDDEGGTDKEDDGTTSALGVIERGIGFLVDRDGLAGLAAGLAPPKRDRPSESEFAEAVADYWYHALWATRKLVRGELWVAVACCDNHMARLLLKMIEWQAKAKNGSDYDTWHAGRFLAEWADDDVITALDGVIAPYDARATTAALDAMNDLFSKLAHDVASRKGMTYPDETEAAVRELLAASRAAR